MHSVQSTLYWYCCFFSGGIIGAIKLRKVHDAFWVKNQLKWMGIQCLVISLPWVVISYFGIIDPLWWQAFWIPDILVKDIIYFGIPALLAVRDELKSSSFSSKAEISDVSQDSLKLESGRSDRKLLYKLFKDPQSTEVVQQYLVHYQDIKMSDYLNFWQKIRTFKKIQEKRALTGHASLIYQKYLDFKNAYIYIDCFSDDQRNMVRETITAAIDGNTEVPDTIFDAMLVTVEEILFQKLLKKFYKSEFFPMLKTKEALKTAFEEL